MKTAFNAYLAGHITREEMYRFQYLHKKLMGDDPFVEVDDTDPEWKELNMLTGKILNNEN